MISITERAANQIRRLMQEQSIPDTGGLKVSVAGGGCAGLSYDLDFEPMPKETEKVFESSGVKLFVELQSYLYLQGTELDFSDGLNGRGFNFTNPNAAKTCGCGTSFSV